eukprot:999839-Amphidinium_carterae.1
MERQDKFHDEAHRYPMMQEGCLHSRANIHHVAWLLIYVHSQQLSRRGSTSHDTRTQVTRSCSREHKAMTQDKKRMENEEMEPEKLQDIKIHSSDSKVLLKRV